MISWHQKVCSISLTGLRLWLTDKPGSAYIAIHVCGLAKYDNVGRAWLIVTT